MITADVGSSGQWPPCIHESEQFVTSGEQCFVCMTSVARRSSSLSYKNLKKHGCW